MIFFNKCDCVFNKIVILLKNTFNYLRLQSVMAFAISIIMFCLILLKYIFTGHFV